MIREAHAGDGPAIARLWTEAGDHHVALDPGHHQHPDPDDLDAWCEGAIEAVAHRGGVSFVADTEGCVVGFVQVVLRDPRPDASRQIQRDQGTRRAWVNAIAVLESHRQRGVGAALMTAAEEWAQAQGAESIQLDVLPSNAAAMALYRAREFEQTAAVLEKRLR